MNWRVAMSSGRFMALSRIILSICLGRYLRRFHLHNCLRTLALRISICLTDRCYVVVLAEGLSTFLLFSAGASQNLREMRQGDVARQNGSRDGTGSLWGGGVYSARVGRWQRVLEQQIDILRRYRNNPDYLRIPLYGVSAEGFGATDSAVVIGPLTCLLPNTDWLTVIKGWADDKSSIADGRSALRPAVEALSFMLGLNDLSIETLKRNVIPIVAETEIGELLDLERFMEVRGAVGWSIFDTRRWQRESRDF